MAKIKYLYVNRKTRSYKIEELEFEYLEFDPIDCDSFEDRLAAKSGHGSSGFFSFDSNSEVAELIILNKEGYNVSDVYDSESEESLFFATSVVKYDPYEYILKLESLSDSRIHMLLTSFFLGFLNKDEQVKYLKSLLKKLTEPEYDSRKLAKLLDDEAQSDFLRKIEYHFTALEAAAIIGCTKQLPNEEKNSLLELLMSDHDYKTEKELWPEEAENEDCELYKCVLADLPTAEKYGQEWREEHGDETIGEVLGLNSWQFTRHSVLDLHLSRRAEGLFCRHTPSEHHTVDELLEEDIKSAFKRYGRLSTLELLWKIKQNTRWYKYLNRYM